MVILAAVSINAAYNSGIIDYAVNGTQNYLEGAKDEESRLASAEGVMDSALAGLNAIAEDDISSNGSILHLNGKRNTTSTHSSDTEIWYDISGVSEINATKTAGNIKWEDDSLVLDGSTYWTVNAPVSDSFGTVEIVISIDSNFNPVNNTSWYNCSTIFGCELGGSQKDWGIIIDKNGYFAIGYDLGTINSSNVYALDGEKHTISFSYTENGLRFSVDSNFNQDINFRPSGTPCSQFGIGWNKSNENTKIKGKIYDIKFYSASYMGFDWEMPQGYADYVLYDSKYDGLIGNHPFVVVPNRSDSWWRVNATSIGASWTNNKRLLFTTPIINKNFTICHIDIEVSGSAALWNTSDVVFSKNIDATNTGTLCGNGQSDIFARYFFTMWRENGDIYQLNRQIIDIDISASDGEDFYIGFHNCDCNVNIYKIWFE